MSITYTFATDCKIPQLRGITATGGEFCRADGKIGPYDAVQFSAPKVAGKSIMAMIAGKPELESALAKHMANEKAVADRLIALGVPEYTAAQNAYLNAQSAYAHASERGYPVREARELKIAEEKLDAARIAYPLAAAYAKAKSYAMARNGEKASAGTCAILAIEGGVHPLQAVAQMEADWSAAAARAVSNQ